MPNKPSPARQRRNKNFEAMHATIIEGAVKLIAQTGIEAVSMAAVGRALGIHRTTLYYHFPDREALLDAVKAWSSAQLARGFMPGEAQSDRIRHISRFVLDNPELIKMWLQDFLAPGDIRTRYPQWDALVDGIKSAFSGSVGEPVDAEVYCVIMLTAAFIGPGVFRNSVRPDLDTDIIAERFRLEQQRMLRLDSLLKM